MPDTLIAPEAQLEQETERRGPSVAVNLLAYVHLRNIYGSTGAGRVARQLIEHLAWREDIRLHVLADARDHARIIPLVGKPWDRFRYHFFDLETSRQQARWFLLDRPPAERFWPEAQVMFCTAESYVPTRTARLVVTLHDAAYFEPNAHLPDRSFSLQRFKWRLLYHKLQAKADLFHTPSEFSAERLGHFYPAIRSRLRVVHNAVAPHFFKPVTGPGILYVRDLGLAARPFVLVPGGLHFRKNAELILDAWPLIRDLYPDLVLAVVNHSNATYVERARALGENFRVLGFVPDDALRALYAAASVVWFPSRYEGFGLPVIEAMACGASVVTSRASSLPEIAGDAALLASPDSTRAHVEAIESLLRDECQRAELRRRGRLRARSFTWARSAEQLKSHFEGLL
jgi:glycosyltransferase involved in cell wall biosynthesis